MCLSRFIINPSFLFYFLVFYIYCIAEKADKCMECRFLVATFKEGLNRTSKSHFGGGNTDWEERKLKKFVTSEIRFAEVMEYVCEKDFLSDSHKFDSKDLQFKCHTLAEDVEDLLEHWFFKEQSTHSDLQAHLCIDILKHCCLDGHFGPNCAACPGFISATNDDSDENDNDKRPKTITSKPRECFGRGTCNGSGTREGTGKCSCDLGYVGKMCSNCGPHYFPVAQNSIFIDCDPCFDGCASGCTAAGPKGCRSCRSGYVMDEQEGCKDIDECLAVEGTEPHCTNEHEKCVNTAGSFYCECEEGYKRDLDGEKCELDIEGNTDHNGEDESDNSGEESETKNENKNDVNEESDLSKMMPSGDDANESNVDDDADNEYGQKLINSARLVDGESCGNADDLNEQCTLDGGDIAAPPPDYNNEANHPNDEP